MKQLILAEKPSVAKDLSQVLGASQKHKHYYEGKQVIVTWALGHLLSLKMPEDIRQDWQAWQLETLPMLPKELGIKPLPKTTFQLKAIRELVQRKDVSEVVIATDAGREGELVARWILEYSKCQKPIKRLWISSQTDKAIREGFKNLKVGNAYDNLYHSALARAKADWLIGLNVTRALTVKYQDNLAAGRVQTPTLALVREQEKKIEAFRPQTYFIVEATSQKASARFSQTFATREQAEQFMMQCQKGSGVISEQTETQKTEHAPLPYDLTELQREANQKYQFSAKKTLSLVQSLYETHKIVTYPRTDSRYLTTDLQATMAERLQAIADFAPEVKIYLKNGAHIQQQAVFQNAKVRDHHALIPTEQRANYAKLTTDENRIYQMIVQRFLGLFASAHQVAQVKTTVLFGKESLVFKSQKVIEAGWKKDAQVTTFDLGNVGDKVYAHLTVAKELTSPPKALSEASLLGAMEKHSLGTPATRAEIIEKLIKSEMMERLQTSLKVTQKGRQLLQLVNPTLVSPKLTATWEKDLEAIEQGNLSFKSFMQRIEEDTQQLVAEIKQSQKDYQDFSLTQKKCPECQSLLKEKNTKDGKIYVCSSQTCQYRRRKDPKVSNHRCPQCHKKMEIIQGKNGDFFKCKYCSISEKMTGKAERQKKLSKHEEKRLLQKINQQAQENVENPFAAVLKAALKQD